MASRRPALIIVGGINGRGKSTFAAAAAKGPKAPLLGLSAINPDDLTRAVIAEFPRLVGDAANLVGVERAEKQVWKAIASGDCRGADAAALSGLVGEHRALFQEKWGEYFGH